MSTKGHNRAIAHAMEFTSNDLTLNQRGDLSPAQQQKLVVMRDLFISDIDDAPPLHIPSLFTLIVISVSTGLLHFLGVLNRLQQGLDTWYRPVLIGISLLVIGSSLWKQFRYWAVRALLPDMIDDMIQSPELYSITGDARLSIEESLAETNYWLMIGDQRFPLTTSAAGVFKEGRTYRIFYIHFADATVLTSAEWLDNNHL